MRNKSKSTKVFVILIVVIILGIGITYVRTKFSDITASINTDSYEFPESEPVAFSPNNPDIKEGEEINVQVGFYNPSLSKDKWIMKVIDTYYSGRTCGGMSNLDVYCGDSGTALETIYNDKPFELPKDEITGWNIIFNTTEDLMKESYDTKSIYLSVMFCSVEELNATDCEGDAEVYQKDLELTIRK